MAAQNKVRYLRNLYCDKTAQYLPSSPRNLANVSTHQSIPPVTTINGSAYGHTLTPPIRKSELADSPAHQISQTPSNSPNTHTPSRPVPYVRVPSHPSAHNG